MSDVFLLHPFPSARQHLILNLIQINLSFLYQPCFLKFDLNWEFSTLLSNLELPSSAVENNQSSIRFFFYHLIFFHISCHNLWHLTPTVGLFVFTLVPPHHQPLWVPLQLLYRWQTAAAATTTVAHWSPAWTPSRGEKTNKQTNTVYSSSHDLTSCLFVCVPPGRTATLKRWLCCPHIPGCRLQRGRSSSIRHRSRRSGFLWWPSRRTASWSLWAAWTSCQSSREQVSPPLPKSGFI